MHQSIDRNPARHVTGGGAERDDQAGKRVNSPYRPSQSKRKASLFEQLVALAHHTKIALQFEHAYGPRPPGKGWWRPVEEDEPEDHYVRYVGRRRRS